MIALEIKLSDWFFNAVLADELLSINRDYFRLRKPLERRLYELARKHCGEQSSGNLKIRVKSCHKGVCLSLLADRRNGVRKRVCG